MGTWAKYGMRFFTGWWNTDLTRDYVFTSCYKVLSADTNDEIIHEGASLKSGVANQIIETELNVRMLSQVLKPKSSESLLSKFIQPAKNLLGQTYFHILNQQET